MKAIVVAKRSIYERVIEHPHAQELLKTSAIKEEKESHDTHREHLDKVVGTLEQLGVHTWVVASGMGLDARNADFVITVGGDGTLLNASHHIGSKTPVLGINSDPKRSVGHFCRKKPRIHAKSIEKEIKDLVEGYHDTTSVQRMEVLVGGKIKARRILNEVLFAHSCPAAMTKFEMDGHHYRCSGAWIATGAGSTGAAGSAGADKVPLNFPNMQFIIREPYGETSEAFEWRRKHQYCDIFKFRSEMVDGVLYFDGPYLKVPVDVGQLITCRISNDPLTLITG